MGGWGVKAERRGRRSWRLDKDVGELCSRLLTLDNAKLAFALCSLNRSFNGFDDIPNIIIADVWTCR